MSRDVVAADRRAKSCYPMKENKVWKGYGSLHRDHDGPIFKGLKFWNF